MITNPDWHKTKVKLYFHQFSLECIEEIAVCMEGIDIEKIDCDTNTSKREFCKQCFGQYL